MCIDKEAKRVRNAGVGSEGMAADSLYVGGGGWDAFSTKDIIFFPFENMVVVVNGSLMLVSEVNLLFEGKLFWRVLLRADA